MNSQSKPQIDQINLIVVKGLLIISVLLWVGIFFIYALYRTVDNAIVLAASSITSGLIGFLSREFKGINGGDDNSTVNNITDEPTKTEEPKGSQG